MSRYWAGSKPFNYLRKQFGIEKPVAAQWGEWDEWKKKTKAEHPVGWWLTEKLPEYLEKIPETFVDPFHAISYYIRNRWYRQTHVLRTGFKPGTYHDFRERILYGNMESLVDFVEIEKAWMQHIFGDDKTPLGRLGRSPEAGMKHLIWEISLDNPELSEYERSDTQAHVAHEIVAIYTWWKEERPKRPDPMNVSGLSDYYEQRRKAGEAWFMELQERTPEENAHYKVMSQKMFDIEAAYDKEDEDMLIRLMKIRLSLWT